MLVANILTWYLPTTLKPSRMSPENFFSRIWSTICPHASSSPISTVTYKQGQRTDTEAAATQRLMLPSCTFIKMFRVPGGQDVDPRPRVSLFPIYSRSERLKNWNGAVEPHWLLGWVKHINSVVQNFTSMSRRTAPTTFSFCWGQKPKNKVICTLEARKGISILCFHFHRSLWEI